MAYSAPTTRATGFLVTAAVWNQDVVDNVKFLANPPACRVYHNTTQSIADVTETSLTFNSERYDTDTMHDTGTNPGRITFKTAGLYLLTATFELAGAADYSYAVALIRLDGSVYVCSQSIQNNATAVSPRFNLSTVYKMALNSYAEVRIYQDNTANAARNVLATGSMSPEFSATWIGIG